MRKADRTPVPAPASLSRTYSRKENRGRTERQVVLTKLWAHLQDGGLANSFTFDYAAYKKPDVRAALELIFHGKCAYCESRYAGTQPMDVEHWRPKGPVDTVDRHGNRTTVGGYPWLASDWENLFPSCIDCNRGRSQFDAVEQTTLARGKASQFPINGARATHPMTHDAPVVLDDALLLNPTVNDPSEHLVFSDDGTVSPVAASALAADSIRVYALNRSGLAFERLGLARLIEQRVAAIETLAEVLGRGPLPADVTLNLQDLVAHEINALYEFARPDRPYSELARQLIAEIAPATASAPRVGPAWSLAVDSMLARYAAHTAGVDHAAVATELVGLGFEPHTSRNSPYLRWTHMGALRLARMYQNSTGLWSDSRPQLAALRSVAGADGPHGTNTRVSFRHDVSSVETVVAAAAVLRAWSDG